MRSEDIDEFVKRKPFEPFRITLTDGRSYDVHHPEYAMIGRSTVALGLPPAGQTHGFYDRLVTVSLLHIMELEPIAKSSSNSPSPN